ncbi:MAG: BACON domain-containing protein [Saprospiraceae bacterium]|nr:BACON domain-containing protein [Candidatus Vicinibacter affinis]
MMPQRRINAGEGKPQEKENHTTNLSVSISTLYFTSYGGTSEQIKVYSNVITYSVPSSLVPSWCTVNTYSGYFTVTASANPNSKSRIDWLKVTVGEIKK